MRGRPQLAEVASAMILFAAAGGAPAAPPGGGWAIAWSDEFDGTAVDASKWSIGTGTRRGAVNTASAVSVAGGALTVKTYTEGGAHYTGWLGSNGKFENCFGYWEARIRYDSSPGMWSAFWLQPYGINNVGDPAGNGTEIDISEHRRVDSGGADMRNRSAINVHWDGYGADHKSVGATVTNPGVNTASLQGNYHTYGLLWEPGKYTFYIDGAEVWSTTAAISNVRQWIYLTSEVQNGSWAGNIPSGGYGDRNATATRFSVDYVRFYQRAEQAVNPGFTHRTGPWAASGAAGWSATGGRSGGPGVRLNPTTTTAAAFEQSIHGLLPNTEYRVLGWGNVGSRYWPDIRIGVKNFGGSETYRSLWSNGFTQAQVPFTTGASNNSARVFARVVTQWGDCYADDIEVRRDAQVNNSGFESGENWPWSVAGDAFVHDWSAFVRSGTHALRLNTSSAARGIEQTVFGLQPGTAYTLSAWVRTSGQPIRFGVKNHGSEETYTGFTGTGNTWQRGTHTFTTGATATSATVYAFIPSGSNVAVADLDDLTLARVLPAPWTGGDIGATGRTGESWSRASKIVIRGSGANVFNATDSFHFVRQPISGNVSLTARLDSFEAASQVAKAGIMLRSSTAADAAHAMVHWLPQGQVEFIWRPSDGATAQYVWASTTTPWPPRLRLLRNGNQVTASYSPDGSAWAQVGTPQSIALPATALAGPAVCAHDTATTAVATFSNLSTSGDRDGDGVLDEHETGTGVFVSATDTGTDPDDPDTDDDGFSDGSEVAGGTNPLVPNGELLWQAGTTQGGSGTWDNAATNWRVGSNPSVWTPGKTALFGGTAGTVTASSAATGIAGLTFTSPSYSIAGTGPLGFQQEAFIASASTGTTTISAPIAGTSSLTISGGGAVHFRGDNRAFTGSIIIDGGTQFRPYNAATGTATGQETGGPQTAVEIRSGSQIRWFNLASDASYPSNFHLAGTGISGENAGALNHDSSTARTLTLTGTVSLDANATIATQNNGAFHLAGPIDGPHTLTFQQAAGTSTISGPLALAALVKAGNGTLTLTTTDLGAGTFSSTAGILEFNPSADALFGGALSGTGTIAKAGPQTLTLAGPNSFGAAGGAFTLGGGTQNAGAIRLAHPQALGNHSKILLNSGQGGVSRLELSGGHTFPLHIDTAGRNTAAGNVALRSTDGANTLQGDLTITATGGAYHVETLTGSSLTITGNVTTTLNNQGNRDVRFTGGGDITVLGSIADSSTGTPTRLAITKEGSGTLRLAGTCTHQPATHVNAGTLRVDGALTASPVNVAAGATLTGSGSLPSAAVSGRLALSTATPPLAITGTLALDNATLEITGSAAAQAHVLATRGALTGSFATVTGIPAGYSLDTSYQGNSIALVRTTDADYQLWAGQHGLDPTGDGSPVEDPDSDGLKNSVEFVLDLDPRSGTRPPNSLPAANRTGDRLDVTFTRRKNAAANGFTSTIEWAITPAGPWTAATPQQTTIHDLGETERVDAAIPLPAGITTAFARLRVESP